MPDIEFTAVVEKWMQVSLNNECFFFSVFVNLFFLHHLGNFLKRADKDAFPSVCIFARLDDEYFIWVFAFFSVKLFVRLDARAS